MSTSIWIRAEDKPLEQRTPVVPEDAAALIVAGVEVIVEASPKRCIEIDDYAAVGCKITDAGSWRRAPQDAVILGLKELPESTEPLVHRHIYFAHVYKRQAGWRDVLERFVHGGGQLFDMEYLVDDAGRRIAAFDDHGNRPAVGRLDANDTALALGYPLNGLDPGAVLEISTDPLTQIGGIQVVAPANLGGQRDFVQKLAVGRGSQPCGQTEPLIVERAGRLNR